MKAESAKPVLHIVFGMSAAGSLRKALELTGTAERVIGLPDDLSFGPINPPDAILRAAWINDELGYDFEEFSQLADQFWTDATSPLVFPVAWLCRRSTYELSGYLEFLRRIGNSPFGLVDITETEFETLRGIPAHREKFRVPGFGMVPHAQMIAANLIGSHVRPGLQAIESDRAVWNRLTAENTALRVFENARLISAPITHFDLLLHSCVTAEWVKCAKVVGEALSEIMDSGFHQCGHLLLWSRMQVLGDDGTIELRGENREMRNCFARLVT